MKATHFIALTSIYRMYKRRKTMEIRILISKLFKIHYLTLTRPKASLSIRRNKYIFMPNVNTRERSWNINTSNSLLVKIFDCS